LTHWCTRMARPNASQRGSTLGDAKSAAVIACRSGSV
jgi:hypothetical protein